MTRQRVALGAAGIALGLFGAFRLVTQVGASHLAVLAGWLAGALVIHDGVLAPLTVGTGALLARWVPPRARAFVQGAVVTGALVTVVALPLIYRRHSQPAVKAILQRDYAADLALLWAVVVAVAVPLYVSRVIRDRRASATKVRPADDHSSPGA